MFSKKDKKKVVSLFDQKKITPDQIRPNVSDALFIETFEAVWEDTTELVQRNMIIYAAELPPEIGIRVVIEKFRSAFYRRCEYTENTLNKIINRVKIPFGPHEEKSPVVVEQASRVAALIYREINFKKPDSGEIKRYVAVLASMGGCGFYYIWRIFINIPLPVSDFMRIVNSLPMVERLVFIHNYTALGISIRRRFFAPLTKVLETIKPGESPHEWDPVINFFAILFDLGVGLDPVFMQPKFISRIGQHGIRNLKIKNMAQLKALMLFNRTAGYEFCRANFYGSKSLDMQAILDLLIFAGNCGLKPDMHTLQSAAALALGDDPRLVIKALKVLVAFRYADLGPVIIKLTGRHGSLKPAVCRVLADMDMHSLTGLLSYLDREPEGRIIRAQVILVTVRRYLLENPEKLLQSLDVFEQNASGSEKKGSVAFRNSISDVLKKERLALEDVKVPDVEPEPDLPKGIFESFFSRETVKGRFEPFSDDVNIIGDFREGLFKNQALNFTRFSGNDFKNAVFINFTLTGGTFEWVSFSDARMENVVMENVLFDSVSFENALLWNVLFKNCEFNRCVFNGVSTLETVFESSRMGGSFFIGSGMRKTVFSCVDLEMSSFAASKLDLVRFSRVNLLNADFSAAKASLCEFSETDTGAIIGYGHSQLNFRTPLLSEIKIPLCLCGQVDGAGVGWFDQLLGFTEMDRQAELFRVYNSRRVESAMDALRTCQKFDQADLFELVPFIIDSNADMLPDADFKGEAPSGIFGYCPSDQVLRLAKKYAGNDLLMLKNVGEKNVSMPAAASHVQGLFTIGSTGSVAQTTVSDIDYWVCIERETLGIKGAELLEQKLSCLSGWAKNVFDKEIHFFQVDLSEVKEDYFGETDYESSGSAQGKILKEEFYRTMIHVGGKIPFWCIYPPQIGSSYYIPFYNAVAPHMQGVFDLGNVTDIPMGEYGGAYLWQFIKSLKSPFKSVVKMALLEKYIQGAPTGKLLCDLLKERWRSGIHDPVKVDSYLLLFEEISAHFKKTGLRDEEELIRRCFFLKLGIESLENLRRSPMGFRKRLLDQCMSDLNWKRHDIEQFGQFGDWSFGKVKGLAVQIKNYMHRSYGKLLTYRAANSEGERLISSEDLTVLGRKVDVHFTSKSFKVEKIPLRTYERTLFNVLYFKCFEKKRGVFAWEASYRSKRKKKRGESDDYEIVCERGRLEDVAAWIILNGLYSEDVKLVLRPNPTPVDHRDIVELFSKMFKFFRLHEEKTVHRSDLLEKPRVLKLYTVVNFNVSRQLEKIREYAVIYTNSWGETFSRAFAVDRDLPTIKAMITLIEQQFDMDFDAEYEPERFGYHIPWAASKRIPYK